MTMIDIVYPLGNGSRFHNNEIRFSLRSIEKHLKNFRNVYVVGAHHPELQNVIFIPYPDHTTISDTNIMRKIARACEIPDLSENFLMVHDDHYLLSDFDAATFPYFYHRTILEFLKIREPDPYHHRVANTLEYLEAKGLPTKFFDIHTPILFNKTHFKDIVTNGPDWTPPNMYVLKSIYANTLRIEGEVLPDQKGDEPPPPHAKIFSTSPRVKGTVQRFLLESFPLKSKYEKKDF